MLRNIECLNSVTRWRHIVMSLKRRSVHGGGEHLYPAKYWPPNDAGISFIVYNYAKNALNVQVVRRKETKFGLDCIFLTLCAGKSAFSLVSPVTMRLSSPRGDQGGQRNICSVKNILNLNRSWIWTRGHCMGIVTDTAFQRLHLVAAAERSKSESRSPPNIPKRFWC